MTGNTTLTEDEEFFIEIITKYLVPVIFSIIVFMGSIGNILVIFVVRFIFILYKKLLENFIGSIF